MPRRSNGGSIGELILVFVFTLAGFDDLLRIRSGNLLVTLKAHREGAARLRHGAQIRGILEHFGERRFSGHALQLADFVHAHDAATALVHIADDVAHVLIRHIHLDVVDGLEQDRVGTGQLLEREAAGADEE